MHFADLSRRAFTFVVLDWLWATKNKNNTYLHITTTRPKEAPASIKDRCTVVNQDIVPGKWHDLSLVSYNCLVDAYEDYGSRVDPQFLDDNFRHAQILAELEYLDGDIICLQEVTQEFYEKTLKTWSTKSGYGSAYVQRIHGRTDEGSAIFYKQNKFSCTRTELVQFKTFSDELIKKYSLPNDRYTMDQEAIIQELEVTGTCHVVVVATTQFGDFRRPDVQIQQMSHLRNILDNKYRGNHVILCGDFNAEPSSIPYR